MAGASEADGVMGGVEDGTGTELSIFHESAAPKPTGALLLRPSLGTRQSLPRASKPMSFMDSILAAQAEKREKREERKNKKWKARMEALGEQMKEQKEPLTVIQQPATPPLSTQPTTDTLLSLSPLTLNALSISEPSGRGIEERMTEFASTKERKREKAQKNANGTVVKMAGQELVVQDQEEKKLRTEKRAAEWMKKEGKTRTDANGTFVNVAALAREAQELGNKLRREKKVEARRQREEQKAQIANGGDVNMTGSTQEPSYEEKQKQMKKTQKNQAKRHRRKERKATESEDTKLKRITAAKDRALRRSEKNGEGLGGEMEAIQARVEKRMKRALDKIESGRNVTNAEIAARVAVARDEKQQAAVGHGDSDMGMID